MLVKWIQNRRERKREALREEIRATLRNPVEDWLRGALDVVESASGQNVTHDTALNVAAVWACINCISEAVASLPVFVYRRRRPRGKNKATQHPTYFIIHDEASAQMTSQQFRQTFHNNKLAYGNGYAQIVRSNGGTVLGLRLIPSPTMAVSRQDNGELLYEETFDKNKPPRRFAARDIFHVPDVSYDGVVGLSRITRARETIGLAMASERSAAALFKNGGTPAHHLETPEALDEESIKRLRASWNATHGGAENQGKTRILESGMTLKHDAFNPEDMQFLQSRQYGVVDVCRWFKIQPHKVQSLQDATLRNIEEQNLEFVTDTLRPHLVAYEQEANRKLFTRRERNELFVEFQVDGLLRGNAQTRHNVFAIGRQWGYYSINDIREFENLNPVKGGDDYLHPMNMQPIGEAPPQQPAAAPANPSAPTRDVGIDHVAQSFQPVIRDAFSRIVRTEVDKLRRGYTRHAAEFGKWRATFLDKHQTYVHDALATPVTTFITMTNDISGNGHDVDVAKAVDEVTTNYVTASAEQMDDAFAQRGDRNIAFANLMDKWELERADSTATAVMDHLVGMVSNGEQS